MTLSIRRQTASLMVLITHGVMVAGAVVWALQTYRAVEPSTVLLATVGVTFVGVAAVRGCYIRRRMESLRQAVQKLTPALTLAIGVGALVALPFPTTGLADPVNLLLALGAGTAGVAVSHLALALGLGRLLHPVTSESAVLVVGNNVRTRNLVADWFHETLNLVEVVGYVDTLKHTDATARNPVQDHWPFLGDVSELPAILTSRVVDEVWITLPVRSCYQEIQEVVAACETVGVPVRVPTAVFEHRASRIRMPGGQGAEEVYYQTTVGKPWQLLMKRAIDVLGSLVLVTLLLPVFILVALAIKLTSRGPVIYRQTRAGLHGRPFQMYKFRSMIVGADALKKDVLHLSDATGPVFKARNDPRITRLGRFLRRTSLDELPQLFNVLRGEMSLVGPRPPVPEEVAQYAPWQRRRLAVLPGITCTWQVSGRSNIKFEEWMRLDLEYASNWSLSRDLILLLRTIPAVISTRGAR